MHSKKPRGSKRAGKSLRRNRKKSTKFVPILFAMCKILNELHRQRYTPQFLLMRLRHSTTAQDDASEALATSFVQDLPDGTSAGDPGTANLRSARETDEFIKTFREARKIYHKRAIWSTKWANGDVIWRED
jgi:hypothetical protein